MSQDNSKKILIVNANIFDGRDGEIIKKGAVKVEGERITEVGKEEEIPKEDVDVTIDANGKYLMPGLIDNHVHIFNAGYCPREAYGEPLTYAGIIALNNLRSALQSGITTVRDVASGHVNIALKTAIERELAVGPRCFVAGKGICMTGGHGHSDNQFGVGANEVDGIDEILTAIREDKKAGADLIKILTSHRSDNPEFTQEELDVAVKESHRFGMKVACHAGNYVTTKMASIAGVDTIEHGIAIEKETADLMVENDVGLVPTLWVLNDIRKDTEERKNKYQRIGEYVLHEELMEETISTYDIILDRLPETMENVLEKDIKIGAGTDNVRWNTPFAMLHEEIRYLTEYGLSNKEALQSATKTGAELLGEAENLGTIEPGKFADMIMVKENPLEDIKVLGEVDWVMKGGKVIPKHPEWNRKPIIESQVDELGP